MSHAAETVHRNSRLSFCALDLSARKALVISAYLLAGVPLSDRDVMERLGLTDPNAVRPRCSECLDEGLLMECGSVKCPETGRKVRICMPTSLARNGVGA